MNDKSMNDKNKSMNDKNKSMNDKNKHMNDKSMNDKDKKTNNKEFKSFDWKSYIKVNNDLFYINSKEEAWTHWINYGKYENRVTHNFIDTEEFKNFDWKYYVKKYDDLSCIKTKELAWKHWINYGKYEKRVINNLEPNSEEYNKFDWQNYVNNYNDLLYIKTKEEAWSHWINHGKTENRICDNIFLFDDYKNFNWKKYINNYEDLTYIDSKEEAWKHFILYGFNEGRKLNDKKEIELYEFKKIIEQEDSIENTDFSLNKIYFKKKYTNCGKHFFGWKSSMNYLLENYNFTNNDFNKKYYFDEWIEKLLVWGNGLQNQKCLNTINTENLQLITFLHGPPFENYNSDFVNKHLILNDDSLLNKNIIDMIISNNLLCSITFLYVLSIYHKNYIINNYPEFKNKVVSLYHPIDINNYEQNELFSVSKFISNKNIYHIGWWLRNFTSFCNFKVPENYNKLILLKQDFKREFNEKFLSIDKNIQIMNEVNDDQYKEIFSSSCIFCDLVDAIANNVVLECIKYNTPLIVRRIPSVEEYLGVNYPLFFDDELELSMYADQKKLNKKIIEANEYFLKMDKTPFMLETFSNKIRYDINKLKINNDTYKLTWLYYLNNETDDIESYISIFNNQLSIENIKLIIINSLSSKIELLEKYNSYNIIIINVDSYLTMNEIYDIFIKKSTTEFLFFKKFNNIYTDENYSNLCISFFEDNPTFDVIIFNGNEKMNTYDEINSINILKLLDDSSSESSNPSDILSESSNKIFNLEKNTLETELETELEIELDTDSISEKSYLENNEKLLTYSQIYNYNFHDQNINILWRKSIHSFIDTFDENFWLNCHKKHFNIFEMN